MAELTLTVRCVSCKQERVLRSGDVPTGDFPMCDRCGMPMLPKEENIRQNRS